MRSFCLSKACFSMNCFFAYAASSSASTSMRHLIVNPALNTLATQLRDALLDGRERHRTLHQMGVADSVQNIPLPMSCWLLLPPFDAAATEKYYCACLNCLIRPTWAATSSQSRVVMVVGLLVIVGELSRRRRNCRSGGERFEHGRRGGATCLRGASYCRYQHDNNI